MTNSVKPNCDENCLGIVCRPPNQLHDLPVQYRWEASRRHPYYLVFWSQALLYRQGELGDHPAQQLLRQAAMVMLGSIGVTGEPVNPGTSFEKLDACKPDPAFLSGAVQPMTLRLVATMLINALPAVPSERFGNILRVSAADEYAMEGDDVDRSLQRWQALSHLSRISSPALDSCPDIPLFYIHLGASQRTIVQDVEQQVRRWKQRRGISERRVHTKKLQSYLDVWDRREGWTGYCYQRSREQSFIEISKEMKHKQSTVVNRYRSAFQMITGHEFLPDLWRRIFGPLKFSELLGDPAEILSAHVRHQLRSPVRRPVPDSVVTPNLNQDHTIGIVEQKSTIPHDPHNYNKADLLIDLKDLIKEGLSDKEIAQKLDFGNLEDEDIAYIRTRLAELGEI